MRAVVYTRISLDRFGDSSGVARQKEDALKLIESRGWELVAHFEDNDASAAGKVKRPGFENLLAHLATGEANALVAWSFDRLARNRRDELRLLELCQEQSITLSLVRGSDIDMSTPAGRMVADMMATTARHEIEVKSDRQTRANLQRAQAGKPHISRRPFGYQPDGIKLNEEEASYLRWAYSQILAGASLKSICRHFNNNGVMTSTGKKWEGTTLRGVLLNPRNAGIRFYKGERMSLAIWEPIVSEDTWHAVKAILEDPARSTTKERSVKFLLSNLAECGRCNDGSKMGTTRHATGRRQYKCTVNGDICRKAEPIDDLTERIVIERLSRPDAAKLVFPKSEVDTKALHQKARTLRLRIEEAAKLFAAGSIQSGQLATITATCNEEIREIENKIAAAVSISPIAGIIGAEDVQEAWHALDVSRKRAILRTLFERIVIQPVKQGARIFDPESVTFVWRKIEH